MLPSRGEMRVGEVEPRMGWRGGREKERERELIELRPIRGI